MDCDVIKVGDCMRIRCAEHAGRVEAIKNVFRLLWRRNILESGNFEDQERDVRTVYRIISENWVMIGAVYC
jgi:hypothetical protein